jgi:hypothetical protein
MEIVSTTSHRARPEPLGFRTYLERVCERGRVADLVGGE